MNKHNMRTITLSQLDILFDQNKTFLEVTEIIHGFSEMEKLYLVERIIQGMKSSFDNPDINWTKEITVQGEPYNRCVFLIDELTDCLSDDCKLIHLKILAIYLHSINWSDDIRHVNLQCIKHFIEIVKLMVKKIETLALFHPKSFISRVGIRNDVVNHFINRKDTMYTKAFIELLISELLQPRDTLNNLVKVIHVVSSEDIITASNKLFPFAKGSELISDVFYIDSLMEDKIVMRSVYTGKFVEDTNSPSFIHDPSLCIHEQALYYVGKSYNLRKPK